MSRSSRNGRPRLCILVLAWQLQISLAAPAALEAVPAFICDDGAGIELAKLCDGRPHCADSSDETLKLCHHIACPGSRSFKCTYGACVEAEARCDGLQDCADASDEASCDSSSECAPTQFRCFNSSECLSSKLLCDGLQHCADASDEETKLCRGNVCPKGSFRCDYGGCVAEEVLCDGLADCADGSDEAEPLCRPAKCRDEQDCRQYACKKNEFACENGRQCVALGQLCDGHYHCRDGSDETARKCATRTCGPGEFRCAYGACVAKERHCDGEADCRDWSDESGDDCPRQRDACRLPGARAGLLYRLLDAEALAGCEERCARPGLMVPEGARLRYACHGAEAGLEAECRAGRWTPAAPSCPEPALDEPIRCWPVRSEGAQRRCEASWGPAGAGWLACGEPVPAGTRASLQCHEHYRRARGSSRLTCLRDGTWSQTGLRCEPVCGVRVPQNRALTTLIVNGWEVVGDEPLPWHATLFSHEEGQWRFFCGGSLVSPWLVLTAAHCVWESDPATVRVVLAGRSSDFESRGATAQVLGLRAIETQTSYQDHEGNYNSDLALLVLTRPAVLGPSVMPACIDWANELDISERSGHVGIVAGMGATENGTYSSSLRLVTAQVVSEERCRENEAPEFRKYLAYTSFCAGWANGTGVCNGDSGGGFMLPSQTNSEVWQIYGIVSLSPRRRDASQLCDLNFYTVFTKLSSYLGWIKKIVAATNSLVDEHAAAEQDDVMPNRDHLQLD